METREKAKKKTPQNENQSKKIKTSSITIATSSSSSSSPEQVLSNNSNVLISSTKSPGVSYRVVDLNSQNSILSSQIATGSNNHFFLMMPNDGFVKKGDSSTESNVVQHRRNTHKEIERRRRDKINDWIYTLSQEVPDCASDHTKQGQSKGGILAKAVKYIEDLRSENITLIKEKDELSTELEKMKKDLEKLKGENDELRLKLDGEKIETTEVTLDHCYEYKKENE